VNSFLGRKVPMPKMQGAEAGSLQLGGNVGVLTAKMNRLVAMDG
jgi:hypothetical protein